MFKTTRLGSSFVASAFVVDAVVRRIPPLDLGSSLLGSTNLLFRLLSSLDDLRNCCSPRSHL